MALVRYTRSTLAKREAEIAQARNLVRGRFEGYDGVGEALVAVAEGAPESWIAWSGMEDDAVAVASALQRGRAVLGAAAKAGAPPAPGGARLTSALSLLQRLGEFLSDGKP